MSKKIIVVFGLLLSFNASAMTGDAQGIACTVFTPALFTILPFDDQRDTQEFLALLNADRRTFLPSEDFSVDAMLLHKSMTPNDVTTHNSLIIKVLRANVPGLPPTELKGFAAYTQLGATVEGCLLAVKKNEQRKHYAQYLARNSIDDAFGEKNALKLVARVSKSNKEVQALFRKVAALYPNLKLEVKEAIEPAHDNPKAEGSLMFELSKK